MAPLLVDRRWIYFEWDGEIYRAREGSPTAVNGYPMGARWWGPLHVWRFCQERGVFPFEQQRMVF